MLDYHGHWETNGLFKNNAHLVHWCPLGTKLYLKSRTEAE